MEINTFTHYQTSFRVKSKNEHLAFPGIQNVLLGWLREKEKDSRLRKEKKQFFSRCEWKQCRETYSSIATNHCIQEDEISWALRYTQPQNSGKQYWYTDVGLRSAGDVTIFYTRISYAWNLHDLRVHDEVPPPTIPRFIRYLLKGEYSIYSGSEAFGLYDRPVPFSKPGHGKALADLILSKSRRYPLVVFNGGTKELFEEARHFAVKLAGKCQVLFIEDHAELAEEIRHYLRKDMRIPFGAFRVFFALDPKRLYPERHRFYDPSHENYGDFRQAIITNLLRNHPLEEPGCIRNISEIGRGITLAKLRQFQENQDGQTKEIEEIYQLVADIERERDEAKAEAEYFSGEYDLLAQEKRTIEAKLSHFQSAKNPTLERDAHVSWAEELAALPDSLEAVVAAFQAIHGSKLEFCQPALDSAREYLQFGEIQRAWEMFYHLSTTLHSLVFGSGESCDLERAFKEVSGYGLSLSESKMTKKDTRLMALRQIEHRGQKWDISPHVKWGNKEPKMLRIHFAFDDSTQKLIVGYVGPHLENRTTRKLK